MAFQKQTSANRHYFEHSYDTGCILYTFVIDPWHILYHMEAYVYMLVLYIASITKRSQSVNNKIY